MVQFSRHPVTGEPVGLFGVFDGHGGAGAAAFVNDNLLKTLLSHEKFHSDLKTAMSAPLSCCLLDRPRLFGVRALSPHEGEYQQKMSRTLPCSLNNADAYLDFSKLRH